MIREVGHSGSLPKSVSSIEYKSIIEVSEFFCVNPSIHPALSTAVYKEEVEFINY